MKTIKIGTQVWSLENLNVEHYRNGDIIPEVQDPEEWSKLTTGAWCYHYNESINGKKHGKLYNWYAVNDKRGLAPEGWHIPTYHEFETLKFTVNNDGNSLKAEGEGTEDGVGTNKSGFSALLSGYRSNHGDFNNLGNNTYYWSSTTYNEPYAYYLTLFYYDSNTDLNCYSKKDGLIVRIIKDKESKMNNSKIVNYLYIEGIIHNTRAIHLCPENPIFYALRGQSRAMLDDLKGCIEDMRKAIELTPDHSKAKEYNENLEQILKDYKEETNG